MATVGFVSTRFAGLDGVTLEAAKLAAVAREAGHTVVWFAGELGEDFAPGMLVPEAHFDSDVNRELQAACFGSSSAPDWAHPALRGRTAYLVDALDQFIDEFGVDVLVTQNSNTIPMQLPLGLATVEVVRRRGIPTVNHHHDFWWERDRFTPTGVAPLLDEAFPPSEPTMRHMVINSIACDELQRRRGIDSVVLPNVMDFEHPPDPGDAEAFRQAAGLTDDDILVLQPTRIIPRKAIEDTIDLAAGIGSEAIVIVTHPERDEGDEYAGVLERHAVRHGVRLEFFSVDEPGRPSLADAYAAADVVSFPSRIEGFGNALLEACYYRRPLVVRRYAVYTADIAPTGLRAIEIDDGITPDVVRRVERRLDDVDASRSEVDHNYEVCLDHFSYAVVRDRFLPLLER